MHQNHDSHSEISIIEAINNAEALSIAEGERFTAPRRKVLETILNAPNPLKAYDIIATVQEDGKPAKPPTVYRALDFLCRLGIVHKIESDATYFACSHHDHCHYDSHVPLVLICGKCGKAQEDHIRAIEDIIGKTAQSHNFKIEKMAVEVHGICETCQKA